MAARTHSLRLRVGLLMVLVFVVAGSTATTALGHTNHVNVRVTAQVTDTTPGEAGGEIFDGQVNSQRAVCVQERGVSIYHNNNFQGRVASDLSGYWRTATGVPSGNHYASVRQMAFKRTNRHLHKCSGDRSPTVVMPPG